MTGKRLNENIIKLELQGICQDCIYLNRVVPIIREMLLEEYNTGLEQSSFDKNMLERDNQELKTLNKRYEEIISDDEENYKLLSSEIKQLKNQQKEFIDWLEDKEKQFDIMGDPINSGACLGILRKYKEIIGDKE